MAFIIHHALFSQPPTWETGGAVKAHYDKYYMDKPYTFITL